MFDIAPRRARTTSSAMSRRTCDPLDLAHAENLAISSVLMTSGSSQTHKVRSQHLQRLGIDAPPPPPQRVVERHDHEEDHPEKER